MQASVGNPSVDQRTARAGETVVLHADSRALILLSFAEDVFYVTAHSSVMSAGVHREIPPDADLYWRFIGYLFDARVIARLDAATAIGKWLALYYHLPAIALEVARHS